MKLLPRHLQTLTLLLLLTAGSAYGQTVYVTKTGEKYHTGTCRYLRYSKISTTLASAKASGYDACSVCAPPTKITTSNSNTPSHVVKPGNTIRQVEATQCTGITKSGARCKRKTTNASGRCYQH